MDKPALVYLCQRFPYPPIKGERITSYNLLRYLVRHYRVLLGTFIDDPGDLAAVPTLRAMVSELHVDVLRRPWSYVRALPRWLRGEPISFALFRSRSMARWLDRVATRDRPVAIVTHSSNISTYAVDRFPRDESNAPLRILHFADVDSEKFVAYAERATGPKKWLYAAEARRVRREELRLTAGADAVAFVSDEEADLFRSILDAHRERVVTLPNGVDTDMFTPKRHHDAPFQSNGAAFIFTGAMDYPPNIEAVTWFAEKVFPGIRAALPNAQFLIVGVKPAAKVQQLAADPSVTITGRVPSVAAYLAHAQVAVAPLRIARGVQNKVLEAMAMAMPVVASSGAMTGIAARPGTHLLCVDSPDEWIDACVGLVRDPERARRMGDAGRELVLDRYNWEAQFRRLGALLAQKSYR